MLDCFAEGPNHIWHVDSYGTLKPYGIRIRASVDGVSCKIMWLKLQPVRHSGLIKQPLEEFGGCPGIGPRQASGFVGVTLALRLVTKLHGECKSRV